MIEYVKKFICVEVWSKAERLQIPVGIDDGVVVGKPVGDVVGNDVGATVISNYVTRNFPSLLPYVHLIPYISILQMNKLCFK